MSMPFTDSVSSSLLFSHYPFHSSLFLCLRLCLLSSTKRIRSHCMQSVDDNMRSAKYRAHAPFDICMWRQLFFTWLHRYCTVSLRSRLRAEKTCIFQLANSIRMTAKKCTKSKTHSKSLYYWLSISINNIFYPLHAIQSEFTNWFFVSRDANCCCRVRCAMWQSAQFIGFIEIIFAMTNPLDSPFLCTCGSFDEHAKHKFRVEHRF